MKFGIQFLSHTGYAGAQHGSWLRMRRAGLDQGSFSSDTSHMKQSLCLRGQRHNVSNSQMSEGKILLSAESKANAVQVLTCEQM